jgi:hypothetical protein
MIQDSCISRGVMTHWAFATAAWVYYDTDGYGCRGFTRKLRILWVRLSRVCNA